MDILVFFLITNNFDTCRKATITDTCLASSCGRLMKEPKKGGKIWEKCGKDGETRERFPDQAECIVEETYTACGLGVYGASLAGDRNNELRCPCQIIQYGLDTLIELAKNDNKCQEWLPKMLCIPNMIHAISLCSYPGNYDVIACVVRRMQTHEGSSNGVSIPICYIHSCHALQLLFKVQMPNCICHGKFDKREFQTLEWFSFKNQETDFKQLERYEIIAARDVSLKPMPEQKFVKDRVYTDFPDPQTCTRFMRCFENGPCFNGTDGGSCGSGEHFKVNITNPEENACYPREQVDCQNVPHTEDSPGYVPICFADNQDFSDIVTAEDNGNITAFHIGVDEKDYVNSIRFKYQTKWATRWGSSNVSTKVTHVGDDEYITAVSGQTVDINTETQRVASMTIEMMDIKTGKTRSETFGSVAFGVSATSWKLSYPEDAKADNGCPMKYVCGGKTNENYIQVLTIHFVECLYSSNPLSSYPAKLRALQY